MAKLLANNLLKIKNKKIEINFQNQFSISM